VSDGPETYAGPGKFPHCPLKGYIPEIARLLMSVVVSRAGYENVPLGPD